MSFSPQPIVIINLDGAGATIGSRRVKNARPDGYTILLLHEAIVTAKYSGNALYGPEAFEPIAGTGRMGLVFAVAQDSEYQSLTDLVEAAQAQPDTLVFAANLGAPVHFVGLMLEQQCPGATFRFTQTGGGTKRLHALKGGHAQVSAFSIEEYSRFQAAGIRAIAYCDTERHPAIPEVPTSHEQGIAVTHVNMQFWWAPKNTPQSRVDYLGDVLEKAMQTESVQARMAQIKSEFRFVVRGKAMMAEVEARRVAISSVDLRKTQALPNVPAFVIPLVVVMGVVVFLKFTPPSAIARQSRSGRSQRSGHVVHIGNHCVSRRSFDERRPFSVGDVCLCVSGRWRADWLEAEAVGGVDCRSGRDVERRAFSVHPRI